MNSLEFVPESKLSEMRIRLEARKKIVDDMVKNNHPSAPESDRCEESKKEPIDSAIRRYLNWGGICRVPATGQRFRGHCGR